MCDATQVTQGLGDLEEEDSQPKEKVWARLITLNPQARPTIDLVGDQFILGRQSCCNEQFKDLNISGKHCRIFKEPCKNGSFIVFLEDLSTNGTFINGEKVGKGNKLLLSSGVTVALVFNKKKPQDTIAYLYQECCEERSFEEGGPHKVYDIREALGAGNFAVVKLAINKATGERFAIKIIDKKRCFAQSSSRKDAIMGEVDILRKLSHPNIINIKEVFDTEKTLYLVLELVECGDLSSDIIKEGHYGEAKARDVFRQILAAVLYLHKEGIAHRDLKPENILLKVTDPVEIKLSDFGLSRTIGDGSFMKTMCGTPQYLAPEIITSGGVEGYGKEVDMWSVGAILYGLLSGQCPFEDGRSVSIFDQIKGGLFDFPDNEWSGISYAAPSKIPPGDKHLYTPLAKDLIKKLLTVNPSLRYTAQQSMDHPWLRGEEVPQPEPQPEPQLPNTDTPPDTTPPLSPSTEKTKKQGNADKKRKRDSSDTEEDESLLVEVDRALTKIQPPEAANHKKWNIEPQSLKSTLSMSNDDTNVDVNNIDVSMVKKHDSAVTNNNGDETTALSKSGSSLKKLTLVSTSSFTSDPGEDADDEKTQTKHTPPSITKTGSKATLPPCKATLPPCLYGKLCYRKNPSHFQEYSHPQ